MSKFSPDTAAPTSVLPSSVATSSVADLYGQNIVDRSVFIFGYAYDSGLGSAIGATLAELRRLTKDEIDGAFYFPKELRCGSLPWRPRYAAPVVLCVFKQSRAAKYAVEYLDKTLVIHPNRAALHFVPACHYHLSDRAVEECLLTFLSIDQLSASGLGADERRRGPARGAAAAAAAAEAPQLQQQQWPAKNLDQWITSARPRERLTAAPSRLYAVILTRQFPDLIDWPAARRAAVAGNAVVLNEREMVSPHLLCPPRTKSAASTPELRGLPSASPSVNQSWEDPARQHGAAGQSSSSPSSGVAPSSLSGSSAERSFPYGLSLQGQYYHQKYGAFQPGPAQSPSGGASLFSKSVSLLGVGARVLQWVGGGLKRHLSSSNTSGGGGGEDGQRVTALDDSERAAKRRRVESGSGSVAESIHRGPVGAVGGSFSSAEASPRRSNALDALPRLNAIGSALVWMPGFQHLLPFVSSPRRAAPQPFPKPSDGPLLCHPRFNMDGPNPTVPTADGAATPICYSNSCFLPAWRSECTVIGAAERYATDALTCPSMSTTRPDEANGSFSTDIQRLGVPNRRRSAWDQWTWSNEGGTAGPKKAEAGRPALLFKKHHNSINYGDRGSIKGGGGFSADGGRRAASLQKPAGLMATPSAEAPQQSILVSSIYSTRSSRATPLSALEAVGDHFSVASEASKPPARSILRTSMRLDSTTTDLDTRASTRTVRFSLP